MTAPATHPMLTTAAYQAGALDMLNTILGQLTLEQTAGVPLDRPRILAALATARATVIDAPVPTPWSAP